MGLLFFFWEKVMKKYLYSGPVLEFDRLVEERWSGETFAPSAGKAKSNLVFQWKRRNNRTKNSRVSLPGELKEA